MKALILLSLLTLSFTSFAQTSASLTERALLCTSVDKYLETEQADMALDVESCLKTKTITAGIVADSTRFVKGSLLFFAPGRPAFKLVCELTYTGAIEAQNTSDVTCVTLE